MSLLIGDSGEGKGDRGKRRQEEHIFKGTQSDQEEAKGILVKEVEKIWEVMRIWSSI